MSASIASSAAAKSARCRCTRVKSSSGVMSSPCGGIAGIEKLALSAYGGLTFFTHRQFGRRSRVCSPLPVSCAVRGQARGFGGAGAVGAFSTLHGRSVCAAVLPVYHNTRSLQP